MLSACSVSKVDRDLLTAARLGNEAGIQTALSTGANANVKRPDGRTPLMLAAEDGDVEAVRLLLGNGADPNVRAVYGETPLMLARPSVVPILVDAGADVNARFGSGRTVLMATTDVDKARALVAAGADVDARNDSGVTALMNVVSNRFPSMELAQVLIVAGADVNVTDPEGRTVLMRAADVAAHEDVLALLIEAGAEVNAGDQEGWTALHYAAADRRTAKVMTLLAANADANARAKNGATAFAVASEHGHERTLALLAKAGADTDVSGEPGTAKPGASTRSWRDTAEILVPTEAPRTGPGSAVRQPLPTGLVVHIRDHTTDGRNLKIRGKVTNVLEEPVHGIRYVVTLYSPEGSRALDTFRDEVDTTIEPEDSVMLRLDVQSMYFGSGARFTVEASPIKVGEREM